MIESSAGAMGESLEWIAGVLLPDSKSAVADLLALAAQARPGAYGTFSSFGVQIMNASAMELPVGDLTLSAIGSGNLSDAGRRSAHARAVVEGLAFAVRANAEQTREAANKHSFTPDQETRSHVGMSGGITRSRFWNQLVADVLG